tara:strand:+ start:338 stop:595 length:258 start_codon:yes stop_codon:yes gene_type:complete
MMEDFSKLNMLKRQQITESIYIKFKRSILGLKCNDGIIIAAEKLLTSKLLAKNTNNRIYSIESHIGFVILLYMRQSMEEFQMEEI